MSFFRKLKNKARMVKKRQFRPLMRSLRPISQENRVYPMPVFEDDFNRIPFVRKAPLGLERLFGRLQEKIRNNPKFRGMPVRSGNRLLPIQPMPVGRGVPFTPPMIPSNTMEEPSLPMDFMPQNMPMERFPMMRQRFAEGGPGRSSIRPPSSRPDRDWET